MSLASVITAFGASYTVTRYGSGSFSNGDWTPGSPSTFSIVASIQPISKPDLVTIPEGHRISDVKQVFTTTELRTRNGDADPDRITINSEAWEVYSVDHWPEFADHYVALVSRVSVTP